MSRNSGVDFFIGVAVGTIIGAAAGLLLAPNEGSETRRIIKEKTKGAVEATKETAHKVKDKVVEKVEKIKGKVTDKIDGAFTDDDVCEEEIIGTEEIEG